MDRAAARNEGAGVGRSQGAGRIGALRGAQGNPRIIVAASACAASGRYGWRSMAAAHRSTGARH